MLFRLYISCLVLTYAAFVSTSPVSLDVEQSDNLEEASLATLEFVAVVTRHGSRTPLKTYPNDPYPYNNKLFWPTGPDELTYYGKQQLYQTGEKLRQRYKMFLPELFYPNDTVAEYNKINRDFMSGACLLASLYPPKGSAIWNQDLLWQPIPLYIRQFDVCGLPYKNRCPAYKAEADWLLEALDKQATADSPVSELMRNISGLTGTNISGYDELFDIYDILTMQVENGFKLPAWTNGLYPEPLQSAAAPLMLTMYGGSEKLVQLGAGPELKHISDMLNMKANGTYEKNRKFYVEAAHDCTLIAMLKAMGVNDNTLIVRTSAYMTFELHYLPEIYIVQVFYYENSADENPKIIDIAECPNPCSLETFSKFVDSINPLNWHEACEKSSLKSFMKNH